MAADVPSIYRQSDGRYTIAYMRAGRLMLQTDFTIGDDVGISLSKDDGIHITATFKSNAEPIRGN